MTGPLADFTVGTRSAGPDKMFAAGSAIRRVWGHPAVMLGAGRALLLQLAHPAVARGVVEHSGFDTDPFGRLERTLQAVDRIVWGTVDDAHGTAQVLRAVHSPVRGDGYDATDPALVLWVHATLVDTAFRMYARWVGPLPEHVTSACYAEAMQVGALFGVPADLQPPDLVSFRSYVRTMVATLGPAIDDAQRDLAHRVLHPPVPLAADPVVAVARQLTIGLLPPPVREGFGFAWDRARQVALDASGVGARMLHMPFTVARTAMPASVAGVLALGR